MPTYNVSGLGHRCGFHVLGLYLLRDLSRELLDAHGMLAQDSLFASNPARQALLRAFEDYVGARSVTWQEFNVFFRNLKPYDRQILVGVLLQQLYAHENPRWDDHNGLEQHELIALAETFGYQALYCVGEDEGSRDEQILLAITEPGREDKPWLGFAMQMHTSGTTTPTSGIQHYQIHELDDPRGYFAEAEVATECGEKIRSDFEAILAPQYCSQLELITHGAKRDAYEGYKQSPAVVEVTDDAAMYESSGGEFLTRLEQKVKTKWQQTAHMGGAAPAPWGDYGYRAPVGEAKEGDLDEEGRRQARRSSEYDDEAESSDEEASIASSLAAGMDSATSPASVASSEQNFLSKCFPLFGQSDPLAAAAQARERLDRKPATEQPLLAAAKQASYYAFATGMLAAVASSVLLNQAAPAMLVSKALLLTGVGVTSGAAMATAIGIAAVLVIAVAILFVRGIVNVYEAYENAMTDTQTSDLSKLATPTPTPVSAPTPRPAVSTPGPAAVSAPTPGPAAVSTPTPGSPSGGP